MNLISNEICWIYDLFLEMVPRCKDGKMRIVKMQFGSHVYGTNTPKSDMDFKSIEIPNREDIIMQKAFKVKHDNTKIGNGKNSANDIDHEIFALHYWFKLLSEGQTAMYDMLFTPTKFIVGEYDQRIWGIIQNNTHHLVNSQISAFAGYCQSQAAKYSLKGSNLAAYRSAMDFFSARPSRMKLEHMRDDIIAGLIQPAIADGHLNAKSEPLIKFVQIEHKIRKVMEDYIQIGPKTKIPMTAHAGLAFDIAKQQFEKYGERAKQAETNQGVDWKSLLHAVRVCSEAEELLLTGRITFPRPEAPLLLSIRREELPYAQVADMIVEGLDKIKAAQLITTLPDKPNQKFIDNFIYDIYRESLRL